MSGTTTRHTGDRERGRFITLEGGEGTGKSTQIQRLVSRLAQEGIETLATREPGGSPKAERLRDLILGGAVAPLGPVAETLAFAAARIDHVDVTIKPALEDGCYVICDRFMDSTRAYQGALGNVDIRLIDQLEQIAVGSVRPDLTIILDLDPDVGMKRANQRRASGTPDRFEAEDIAFHKKVREAFLAIAASQPDRCVVIDASASADEVEKAIWEQISKRFLHNRERTDAAGRNDKPQLRVIAGAASRKEPK